MLKRIYVNNFNSLVNFEMTFDGMNLFLGGNGSGKSSVFDVLRRIQTFLLDRYSVDDCFPFGNVTEWQLDGFQTFELELETEQGQYVYKLSIEHNLKQKQSRINQERLSIDGQMLLEFNLGEAQLYRDDGSKGPVYPFDWNFSAVGAIPERNDNKKLSQFKVLMRHFIIVHPIPNSTHLNPISDSDEARPAYHLDNFVSWYRHLIQDGNFSYQLTANLRQTIDSFDSLILRNASETKRALIIRLREEGFIELPFDVLSDGQRMLIMLYTLLNLKHYTSRYPFSIFIDEPANFVTLREIQPWLQAMQDACMDDKFQVTLISHHPEVINYLLNPAHNQSNYWFERENGLSPTRIKRIQAAGDDGLPASELIARGWFPDA